MKTLISLMAAFAVVSNVQAEGLPEDTKMESMLYTVVQLAAVGSPAGGSGVVIHAEDGQSYIITAKHVAENAEDWMVTTFPSGDKYIGEIVYADKKLDISLLRAPFESEYVAKMAKRAPAVFTEVWNIGSGLLEIPHPTDGIVSIVENDDGVMQTTAEVVDGMSGGGTFFKRNGEYLYTGVITSMALYPAPHIHADGEEAEHADDVVTMQRLTHMAYSIPVKYVKAFLKRICRKDGGFACRIGK